MKGRHASSEVKRGRKKNFIGGGIMTVILVLFTFVTFLVIDHFYSKRHVEQPAVQPILAVAPARAERADARLRPSVVAGFEVPDNMRYHPGHTWALSESPNLVRVGMDDFASKLLGKAEAITLPQRGQWIRQGQKLISVMKNGRKIDMVSPIEGSVSEINEALVRDPETARKDPYGEGWLVTVQSPDAKTNFRNLLGGALARGWMQEAATRLQRQMPQFAGALAQDGGAAVDDLSANIPDEEFAAMAHEFFLC
jgi:glycine cleavage system H lipoate-binding protein